MTSQVWLRPAAVIAVFASLILGWPAFAATSQTPSQTRCVLLLGSYPSEVSANLDREHLAAHQPTVLSGHDFYSGTLDGARVIIGIAGPSPALTHSVTLLALRHFACVTAVVFSGTAGGGGRSGLADVTAPQRWTGNEGKTYLTVSASAMKIVRSITSRVAKNLSNQAAVDDGPCACSGQIEKLPVVPVLRTPKLVVGGEGLTYGGNSDSCFAAGGDLEGCNPCPPVAAGSAAADSMVWVKSTVTQGAKTSQSAAVLASWAAKRGVLIPHVRSLLQRHTAPKPDDGPTTSGTNFIADDQQTYASMTAAKADHIPFIAFRGISDTANVGDLWPFEYAVYQQLAADNSAVAARTWIQVWSRSH